MDFQEGLQSLLFYYFAHGEVCEGEHDLDPQTEEMPAFKVTIERLDKE